MKKKNVAILGVTGSIGASALEVLAFHQDRFDVHTIAAHSSWESMHEIVQRTQPQHVVLTDPQAYDALSARCNGDTELACGVEALCERVRAPEVDVVLVGISGAAGLLPTIAAARAGKVIGLANKESMVMAGPILQAIAAESGARILPVDSEHSAIFQVLSAGRRSEVQRLLLTASGGPFRELSAEELKQVTPEQALRHPTWDMGAKITIDSASLINKALEVVEARWLFDIPAEQIEVVVHPQSICHSMVEFQDGSVIAQMSLPDMKLPIQYALSYPDRLPGKTRGFDFDRYRELTFLRPDVEKFPGLELGFRAAREGGTMGAVLNAANEVAVNQFLAGEIPFTEIPRRVGDTMARHELVQTPDLDAVFAADRWAREEILHV